MRFRKVLLIYPHYPGSHYNQGKSSAPPIGLGYVAEMLRLHGIEYEVVDLGLGYSIKELLQIIDDYRPDAAAISLMTFRYKHHYSVIEEIRNYHKDIKIIVGGPHVTAWKEKVLMQCSAIDYGISREGERTIVELCQGNDETRIKGLVYRNNGEVRFNGERELIGDLDNLAVPTYDRFELDKYSDYIPICSSRGCPFRCVFCQSRSMLGNKWRPHSAERVVAEIEHWYRQGYRHFSFVDDNLTLDKQRMEKICERINSRALSGLQLRAGGIRADCVDQKLLSQMREAGFYALSFGVESAVNRVLDNLNKRERIEEIDKAVKEAINLDFQVKLYFLVGSPYETFEDVKESIEFVYKYPIVDVNFGSLMPIPDTELFEWVKNEGRFLRNPEEYLNDVAEFERIPLFVGPGMTEYERIKALQLTEKVRKKIARRRGRNPIVLKQQLSRFGQVGYFLAKFLCSPVGFIGLPVFKAAGLIYRAFRKIGIIKP